MRTTSILATAALVGTLALVATPASAAPLTCGSTVTVSRSLTTDLTCPGDVPALTLGPGVTLNLKRHRITGPGTGEGIGILVPPHGDVVIRNGTLAGWGTGIATGGVGDEPRSGTMGVDRVTVTGSTVGIAVIGKAATVTRSNVTQSRVGYGRTGITATGSPGVRVSASSFIDSGTGLKLMSSDAEVSGARFVRAVGIDVTDGEVRITGSTFLDGVLGVTTGKYSTVILESSVLRGNVVGVDAQGSILPRDPTTVTELSLTGNTFTSNFRAVELTRVNGVISGNVFRKNESSLFGFAESLTGLLVADNVLDRNGDGINLFGVNPKTALRGNISTRNSGWGIYAPGVTDLGGNRASGNGYEPQCDGVLCERPRS